MYVHRTVAAGRRGAGAGIVSFFAQDRLHVLCTFRSLISWLLQGFCLLRVFRRASHVRSPHCCCGRRGAGAGRVSFFAQDRLHVLCTFRSLISWFLQGFCLLRVLRRASHVCSPHCCCGQAGGGGRDSFSFFAQDRLHVLCTFRSLISWFLQGFCLLRVLRRASHVCSPHCCCGQGGRGQG